MPMFGKYFNFSKFWVGRRWHPARGRVEISATWFFLESYFILVHLATLSNRAKKLEHFFKITSPPNNMSWYVKNKIVLKTINQKWNFKQINSYLILSFSRLLFRKFSRVLVSCVYTFPGITQNIFYANQNSKKENL